MAARGILQECCNGTVLVKTLGLTTSLALRLRTKVRTVLRTTCFAGTAELG